MITLIMVSVIQKLSPHFSLAKWILCSTGLTRYLHPTDDELRKLSGVPREKNKSKKEKQRNGHAEHDKPATFHVPRSLDVQLETIGIAPYDIVHLRYYTEYQWLVDFSLYTSIVYIISEVGGCDDQQDLGVIWFFCIFLDISVLFPHQRGIQSEHAVVSSGRLLCIVSFSIWTNHCVYLTEKFSLTYNLK